MIRGAAAIVRATLWAALAVLSGCAGGGGGGGVEGGASKPGDITARAAAPSAIVPATTPLSSARLSVNVSRALVYASADGKRGLVVQRDPPPDCVCAGRTWQVRRFEMDVDPADAATILESLPTMRPTREQTFLIVPGNAIAMVSEINREEGVEVVFDPPLVVMPDGLPGVTMNNASFAQHLTMTVHPIGDRKTVKRAGRVTNTLRYVGDERIATPAGDFIGRRVESVFEADLAPARVVSKGTQWFADGVGLVREVEDERTSALGVPIRKNIAQWTVYSFTPGAPPPAR